MEEQKWILIHTFYKHFYTWAGKRHPTLTGNSRKTPTNRNHTDTHLSCFVHSGLMALHVFLFVSRFEMNIDDYEMLQTMADTGTASLDTTTPIYFGGVPPEYKIKDGSSLTKNRFIGCIGDITVQKKWVNRKENVLFLCCSLEKGKATWLSPERKVKAKEWFFGINIDGTTKWTLQVKMFAQFPHLYTNWCLLFSSPLCSFYFLW